MFKKIVAIALTVLMLCSTISISTQAFSGNTNAVGLSTDTVYSGNDLGASYTKEGTTFKVWAPTASSVILNRYSTGSDSEANARLLENVKMTLDSSNGVWSCYVKGDIVNTYYTYSVTVDGVTNETQDVYSYAVGVNGNRSMVVDLDSTDPEDWENDRHVLAEEQTDAVIWEVHVRDFSISASSGVSEDNKGKYLAFTEGGTTVNGDTVNGFTCIDYLVEQGVKFIHLNPVYDFGSVDETRLDTEQYNWGYDPVNYNVPDGSYSSNPYDGNVRIKEFKMMIQALHDRGIGVIMDVVYNHTYSTDSCFQFTVPDYYYRMKDGSFTNGSGCGNEMATENAMYRKYVIDSVKYWAEEYHIDGFRFDLMAMIDITTMNQIRSSLDSLYDDGSGKKILIYGEPWVGDYNACALPLDQRSTLQNANKLSDRIAFFNDNYRDAVKGSTSGTDGSFIQNVMTDTNVTYIKAALGGNMGGTFQNRWTSKAPTQNVLYQSAHDNLTLYDKLYASTDAVSSYEGYNETAEKLTMLAELMTITGQGIPFALAGEEFARTKFGDENSYNSSDEINELDWTRTQTYAKSTAYYKGLIQIRDAYSPFSDGSKTSGNNVYFCWTNVPNGCLAYTLENKLVKDGSEWDVVAVLVNTNKTESEILLEGNSTMPSSWTVIANGEKAGIESLGTIEGNKIKVPAQSAMILVDKNSFDRCSLTAEKTVTITVNHYYKADENSTETKLLKSTENVYRIGDTFRIKPDNNLSFYYKYIGTDDATTGVVENDDYSISFYYTDTDYYPGVVNINYYNENGEKIKKSKKILTAENTSFNYSPSKIQGYQLDTSKLPASMSGTMAKEDVTIDFYYKKLETNSITVHYWNTMSGRCYFYCYTDEETKILGAWPGKLVNTKDDEGYMVYTVDGISEAKFVFNNSNRGQQDPGANMPGYEACGEVWIKDRVVTFNSKVITSYVDVNGKKLADDDIKDYNKATKKTTYSAEKKDFDGLTLAYTPGNISGVCTPGVINIVMVYESAKNIINYNANGGFNAPENQKVNPDTKNTITDEIPSKNNFVFLGWSLSADSDEIAYRPGDEINASAVENGLTLYAVWKANTSGIKFGDVDNSGEINMVDVTTLQKHIASLEVEVFNEAAADVTGDSQVNMLDVTTIQRFIASLIDKFPAEGGSSSTDTDKPIPTDSDTNTDTNTDTTTDSNSDTDKPRPTDTDSEEKTFKKIYFQNNWLWSEISAYTYEITNSGIEEYLGEWPGSYMDLCDFTYEGYEMYSITVPSTATVVINGYTQNGSETKSQDFTLDENNAYKLVWYDGNFIESFAFDEKDADTETDTVTDIEQPTDTDITYETREIYFRNDWNWSDVCVYAYNGAGYEYFGEWPGKQMDLTSDTSNGYEVYTLEIPVGFNIIFNGIKDDNSGQRDESPSVLESDFFENCFAMVWHDENAVMNFDLVVDTETETETDSAPDTDTATDTETDTTTDTSTDTDTETDTPIEKRTVYFVNNWLWTDVRLYYFYNEYGIPNENQEFPGEEMTLTSETYGDEEYEVYSCVVPSNGTIIFSGIKNGTTDEREQSIDLALADFEYNWFEMLYSDGQKTVNNFENKIDSNLRTIYFVNTSGIKDLSVFYYVYDGEEKVFDSEYPGRPMTLTSIKYYEMDVYSFTLPVNAIVQFTGTVNDSPYYTNEIELEYYTANCFEPVYHGIQTVRNFELTV